MGREHVRSYDAYACPLVRTHQSCTRAEFCDPSTVFLSFSVIPLFLSSKPLIDQMFEDQGTPQQQISHRYCQSSVNLPCGLVVRTMLLLNDVLAPDISHLAHVFPRKQ